MSIAHVIGLEIDFSARTSVEMTINNGLLNGSKKNVDYRPATKPPSGLKRAVTMKKFWKNLLKSSPECALLLST